MLRFSSFSQLELSNTRGAAGQGGKLDKRGLIKFEANTKFLSRWPLLQLNWTLAYSGGVRQQQGSFSTFITGIIIWIFIKRHTLQHWTLKCLLLIKHNTSINNGRENKAEKKSLRNTCAPVQKLKRKILRDVV